MIGGVPIFRFTIFNTALYPAGIIVAQPLGWKDSAISLERDKINHSLVEYFKGSFIWYGNARRVIREIESAQGPDAIVGILIELNYGSGFEEVFTGLIDISQIEDISKSSSFYKSVAPIIRDDFWAKFINRSKTPVDLQGTLDLDGNVRTAVNKIVLPLPSQKIRQRGEYQQSIPALIGTLYDYTFADPDPQFDMDDGGGGPNYAQINFDTIVLGEVKTKHEILTAPNQTPIELFTALYDGEYNFESKLSFMRSYNLSIPSSVAPNDPVDLLRTTEASGTRLIRAYLQKNDEAPIEFAFADTAVFIFTKISGFTEYTINQSFSLIAGDRVTLKLEAFGNWYYQNNGAFRSFEQLYMIGRNTEYVQLSGGGFGGWTDGGDKVDLESFQDNYGLESYLKITADTVYTQTNTDAFLIKDAAESIISKYVGADNVVISETLGATDPECRGLNAIMRGKNVRGWDFSEKEFSMSWDEWREGAFSLLKLGLGYTKVLGVNKIEIESLEEFYNPDPSINFSNVPDLVRTYDLEKYIKSIEIGFEKGLGSESDSGIDDPQTKRWYNTKFATIGKDERITSKWIAASLAIERSRRNRVELGQDDRNDEDIMVIALRALGGGEYTPELDENFDSVTGLLNADTRYNIRHATERMMERWKDYFNGCLQHLPGEKYYFRRGEGNYSMVSKLNADDCEYSPEDDTDYGLEGNQDIPVSDDFIWIPKLYRCRIPMSWANYKTIRDNRKRAIGISQGTTDHVSMFIVDMDFKIMNGSAEMLLLLGEDVEI